MRSSVAGNVPVREIRSGDHDPSLFASFAKLLGRPDFLEALTAQIRPIRDDDDAVSSERGQYRVGLAG